MDEAVDNIAKEDEELEIQQAKEQALLYLSQHAIHDEDEEEKKSEDQQKND